MMSKKLSIIGIMGMGIVFIILKLTNVIDWSWYHVTLPFSGGFGLIVFFLIEGFDKGFYQKNRRPES